MKNNRSIHSTKKCLALYFFCDWIKLFHRTVLRAQFVYNTSFRGNISLGTVQLLSPKPEHTNTYNRCAGEGLDAQPVLFGTLFRWFRDYSVEEFIWNWILGADNENLERIVEDGKILNDSTNNEYYYLCHTAGVKIQWFSKTLLEKLNSIHHGKGKLWKGFRSNLDRLPLKGNLLRIIKNKVPCL